jgi:hypothetical protein
MVLLVSVVYENLALTVLIMSRTQEEFAAGHVEGALNIPYLLKVGPGKQSTSKTSSGFFIKIN